MKGFILLSHTDISIETETSLSLSEWHSVALLPLKSNHHQCSCAVFLQKNQRIILLSTPAPFDGRTILCQKCKRVRSDASLLLGLLSTTTTTQNSNNSNSESSSLFICRKDDTSIALRVEIHTKDELLCSMLRNDWDAIDEFTKVKSNQLRKQPRLFPLQWSLSELYSRVPATTWKNKPSPSTKIIQLPNELWIDRVTPFMAAPSLQALRKANTEFHNILAAVVPGLKLKLYRHQIASLIWMRERETQGVGGILADDPGLGKTITILALVLQTMGMKTKSTMQEQDKDGVFVEYWRNLTADLRRPILTKLLNRLVRESVGRTHLFPIGIVQKNIQADVYHTGMGKLKEDMEFALGAYEPQSAVEGVRKCFERLLEELKLPATRNSRVDLRSNSLIPSAGSLLVVPGVLLEHWKTQINSHVDTSYVTDKIPLIYEPGMKGGPHLEEVQEKIGGGTYFPFLFIDSSATQPLPDATFLADFRVILTTTQRMTREWKNGSFQKELIRQQGENQRSRRKNTFIDYEYENVETEDLAACSLLKVRWLRLVVDEGHSMAKGQSSAIQFASWISAERRWVMTGTPTKQSAKGELTQVRALLQFLEDKRADSTTWYKDIAPLWRKGHYLAWFRLKALLEDVMKRHTKLDIVELPAPSFKDTSIPMSFMEVTTYNTIVCAVQANLAITAMDGKTSGAQDSLLHRSQAKHARNALANVRRVCVGYSRVIPTLETRYYAETVELLKMHGRNADEIDHAKQYIHRAEAEGLTHCGCCKIALSTLLLFPCCAGLLCPECFDGSNVCTLCDQEFDVDDFQRLQPGFTLEWKDNLSLARRKGGSSQVAELTTNAETQNGEIAIVNPVVPRNGVPHADTRPSRRFGDGHECSYTSAKSDGKCRLCRTEHGHCNFMNEERRCSVCFRRAQPCTAEESKSSYLVKILYSLYQACRSQPRSKAGDGSILGSTSTGRPLKAIIFSQFRQGLNMAGSNLLWSFGSACVAEYWGNYRANELHKFTNDPECFCMLLGRDGSEGLDLSFVTHIFFLEEVMDQAMKDQAVARAWRMGARGRVVVETLTARNTVEVTMQKINAAVSKHGTGVVDPAMVEDGKSLVNVAGSGNLTELKRAKMEILLKSLKLSTDFQGLQATETGKSQEQMLVKSIKRKGVSTDDGPEQQRRRVVSFAEC